MDRRAPPAFAYRPRMSRRSRSLQSVASAAAAGECGELASHESNLGEGHQAKAACEQTHVVRIRGFVGAGFRGATA